MQAGSNHVDFIFDRCLHQFPPKGLPKPGSYPQVAFYLEKGVINLNSIFVTVCNIGGLPLRIFAY